MVAKEIFARLQSYRDSNPDEPLLLNVLHTQVIPHVDATRQKKIQQQLDQVLHTVDAARRENSLSQKRRDLEQIFDGPGLAAILGQVPVEKKNHPIDQLHTLVVKQLKGCKEDIERIQRIIKHVPDGINVISQWLDAVPSKASALIKILDLSMHKASHLLGIIKNVPTTEQQEIVIDQLHIFFVDKRNNDADFCLRIVELDIPGNEIADVATLLNCTNVLNCEPSTIIHDLKKIVPKHRNGINLIIELFTMVPTKMDHLRKILQLPGDTDAVLNLLELLKKAPTQEQKETLIDQIHTCFFEHNTVSVQFPSFSEYLSSFKIIPENERFDFIYLFNNLLLSNKSCQYEQFDDYIQFFKICPPEERRMMVDQAKRLLTYAGPLHTPYDALKFLQAIPEKEMRTVFLDQIPTFVRKHPLHYRYNLSVLLYTVLFQNEIDTINQDVKIYYYINDLPIQKQVALIIQAQRCYAELSPLMEHPLHAVVFLKDRIPENERDNFIVQLPRVVAGVNRLNGLTNEIKLGILCFIFLRVRPLERLDFTQHLCNLMVPNRQNYLEELLAFPPDERAERVLLITVQYWLTLRAGLGDRIFRTLVVDPADFSDEARNPTRPLLQLFEEMGQTHRFPTIVYQNSVGMDEGGLTRDFVTKMFQALCHPDQTSLPLMEIEGRYLPKLESAPPPALPRDEQIKCYKAIGMLFARTINGNPSFGRGKDSVTTGSHFHSHLFAMIHALTLNEMNLLPDPLMEDSVPAIRLKLTKFYLKTQYPQIFRPNGIEEAVIDGEIAQLMNGMVSDRLQRNEVTEDFLKDYHVNSIIQAILIIAKSMHNTLSLPDQWAEIVGNSPEALRKKIEGSLTPDLVIDAFELRNEAEETRRGMIKRWIRTATPEALKNFVFSLTGSTSLAPGQRLGAHLCDALNNPENAPVFHTCSQYMDLPRYDTYEIFEAKLAISIASALAGGFQLA